MINEGNTLKDNIIISFSIRFVFGGGFYGRNGFYFQLQEALSENKVSFSFLITFLYKNKVMILLSSFTLKKDTSLSALKEH